MASDERHSICLEDKILSPLYSFTVAKGQLCDGCQAAEIAPDIKKWYRSNGLYEAEVGIWLFSFSLDGLGNC